MQFVDTKVRLCAISQDPEQQQKAARANELLAVGELGLSVQVLQEFYVQATRESRADRLSHEQAEALVASFRRFPVQETTVEDLSDGQDYGGVRVANPFSGD